MNSTRILAGGRVVTPQGVVDGWIRVEDGTISEIGTGTPPSSPGPVEELGGRWVVPGFVDIHCHGGGGGSFTSLELDQAQNAVDTHREHGTTTLVASLVSAPLDDLTKQVGALSELVTDGLIAGVHLEGPFLSSARCGAHDPAILRPPEPQAVEQLLNAGQNSIAMVTLAPELEHSVNAVRQLADHGVIAAVGHTDATFDQVVPAIDAGATVATHLFNGMRPLHHREPGPIGAVLGDERVTIELICDLIHLHPAAARLAAEHAGRGRTVLITDAISATAAGDGTYELGSLPVTVADGVPTLEDGSLAGSTLTMDAAFRNFVVGCGMSVEDAVTATATRPAELLGMADRVGSLRAGASADLVVLDEDWTVRRVMKTGSWAS